MSYVAWNPTQEPQQEPDTLFLLDADVESAIPVTSQGLIAFDPSKTPWSAATFQKVPGRFRSGIQGQTLQSTGAVLPVAGYIPLDQFTVEFQLKGVVDWSTVTEEHFFSLGGAGPLASGGGTFLDVWQTNGVLHVDFQNDEEPLAANYHEQISKTFQLSPAVLAGQWVSLAVTWDGTSLRTYQDGAELTALRITPLHGFWREVGDNPAYAGLGILSGYNARSSIHFVLSDLRISRYARTPGATPTGTTTNIVSVDLTAPTGATINHKLLGGLHTIRNSVAGSATSACLALAAGNVTVIRTDKMLTCTPIKAGSPDGTHPTLGHSGLYSYDWQVVDRTINAIKAMPAEPYISIDSCPQLLGGSVAPFSGTALTTEHSGDSGFAVQVPTSLAAFGQMAADLVYHITVELGVSVPYWGVWNEPDATSWAGTQAQYQAMFASVSNAVKAVAPTVKIGGPELADMINTKVWMSGLIAYCKTNSVALDFVCYHGYEGSSAFYDEVIAYVNQQAATVGMSPTPEVLDTEATFADRLFFGSSPYAPFTTQNYSINDWSASFLAWRLMRAQDRGLKRHIFTYPIGEAGALGFASTGLMSAADTPPHAWAPLNVYRMWAKLAPNVVSSSYLGFPGVHVLASTDGAGRCTILLVHHHYRRSDPARQVTVNLTGLSAGTVTQYQIDASHSNAYDAGLSHADLETVTPPALVAGSMAVTLSPRTVVLLEVTPLPTPLNYVQTYAASSDTIFLQSVAVSLVKQAIVVIGEDPTIANHNLRERLARRVIQDQDTWSKKFAIAVALNNNIQTGGTLDGASTADIDAQVVAVWNGFYEDV